jgi:hypothetical protein
LTAKEIYLVDIGQHVYKTLLFGRKLYSQFGYNGLTQAAVELKAPDGCIIRPMVLDASRPQFRSDLPFTIDESYTWPIEADTHQLGR